MATSGQQSQTEFGREPRGEVPAQSARAALDRVLASGTFQASERLSRFLRHLAERALQGRTEGLKEYTLGVDVLGRNESFDPRIDSIVRVEASRLRKRLAIYYSGAGTQDPVRIELPPGSYVPIFRPAQPIAQPNELPAGFNWRKVGAAAVVCLALAASAWVVGKNASLRQKDQLGSAGITLAVLPFVNLNGAPEDDRLADGITTETIALLAQTEGIRVIARSSVFQYKGRSIDVRQIGRELSVAAVVEGAIRREGEQIRVTAQVANTHDGFQRWQRSWEKMPEELPELPAEIARGIARALEVPPRGDSPLLRSRTAGNAEAYRLVLKARYLTPTTPENAASRIAHYRSAIGRDPGYAVAWLGMADTWGRLANAAEAPPRSVMPQAREAAFKALQLDPALPDAHLLAANIHWSYDWDWPAADGAFRRAIELDPDSGTIRNFYAQYLAHMGRFADALRQVESLRTLEPLEPESRTMEANVLFLSRQYDRTLRLCEAVLSSHPRIWGLQYWLGRVYESQGRSEESLAVLERLHPPGELGGRGFGVLGALYARMGRREDARMLLARAMDRATRTYVSPVSVAQIHIGLGDFDQAFEWLEKGYRDRDGTMTALRVEPAFDAIRSDPRFVSLLRRLALQ